MDVNKLNDGLYAVLHTEKGDILLSLAYKKVPLTVANFVGLAEGALNLQKPGTPFYDGLVFHRVVPNFMIQGGDPKGNGTGGPGYMFPDEFDESLRFDGPGVLAMANAGPKTNGSQFFITHVQTPWLNDHHSIFGRVVEGQDVVDAVQQGDHITKLEIVRVGDDAKQFSVSRETFAGLLNAAIQKEAEKEAESKKALDNEIRNRYPSYKETKSGLKYVVEKEGDGKKFPKYGQEVTVHYEGFLMDGTKFDSSLNRGTPATFRLGEVIEGWNEGLQMMSKGAKYTFIIPPELGYGTMGYPGVIPPNSTLIFNVELIRF